MGLAKSVTAVFMQTPCQGGHRGVRAQSYRGTGSCFYTDKNTGLDLLKKRSKQELS